MIVLNPIFESWDIFFKSDTPFISDARIKGTAINFKTLIKIVPKGFIQSTITCFPKLNCVITIPNNTPKDIPIKICQCNASFFISNLRVIIS